MSKPAVLSREKEFIGDGNATIVIRNFIAGIKGGATLNVDGYPHNTIRAGHVVIYDTINKEYKPMPLNEAGDAYGSLPANHRYAGVVMGNVLTSEPCVGIMYAGEVNDVASPYSVESIMSDITSALPQLVFMHD